jgi:hypothetical protein
MPANSRRGGYPERLRSDLIFGNRVAATEGTMHKASSPALALLCLTAAATPACADLVISGDATQNVSCAKDVCSATAQDAVLNVNDVEARLAAANLKILSGHVARDIAVAAPLSWTSASSLSLDAYRSIHIRNTISVAGTGGLELKVNDKGRNGVLSFPAGGKINFFATSNPLVINGGQYTLVDSIATLASAVAGDPGGRFALANDFDATGDGTYGASPVPELTGTFNGLGNTISNLSIADTSADESVGLVGSLTSGFINNLVLKNANVSGPLVSSVGTVAGLSDGRIENVSSQGSASGGEKSTVGELVGYSRSFVEHGTFYYGAVFHCRAEGAASGSTKATLGGLAGISTGVMGWSSAQVAITGGNKSVIGGLVGVAARNIDYSYAGGSSSGGQGSIVGGLVGENFAVINESYATGAVTTAKAGAAGGLVGYAGGFGGEIIESYSSGKVSGVGATLGGLIGYDASTKNIFNSHWDTDTSGITDQSQAAGNVPNDPGVVGLSDAQFRSGVPADFDPREWAEKPRLNHGLPYLKANKP